MEFTRPDVHLLAVADKILEIAVVPAGRVGCPRTLQPRFDSILALAVFATVGSENAVRLPKLWPPQ